MVRDTTLPIEYCAYMVAIMVTRYEMDDREYKIQQANQIVAEKLNSSWMGQKSDFHVTTSALHHGIFLFKKSLITLGYCGGANGERGREKVGLVTESLG